MSSWVLIIFLSINAVAIEVFTNERACMDVGRAYALMVPGVANYKCVKILE